MIIFCRLCRQKWRDKHTGTRNPKKGLASLQTSTKAHAIQAQPHTGLATYRHADTHRHR